MTNLVEKYYAYNIREDKREEINKIQYNEMMKLVEKFAMDDYKTTKYEEFKVFRNMHVTLTHTYFHYHNILIYILIKESFESKEIQ